MSNYIVNSSEKTSHSASEQETKTMLYLMGYFKENIEITTFVIDVFNDVTGSNDDFSKLWDSQSKGDKSLSAKKIGESLVTLFKNYLSDFNFDYLILSIRSLSNLLLLNPVSNPISLLQYDDFTDDAKKEIKEGLIDESKRKTYIYKEFPNYSLEIDAFLNKFYLVYNNDNPANYIKKLSFSKSNLMDDEKLISIFEDIRNKQLSIKSSSNVNNYILTSPTDVNDLGRTITVNSINLLILSRLVGIDFIEKNKLGQLIPVYFIDYLNGLKLNQDDKLDYLQDCINNIYRMLLNKNMNKEFWIFLNSILLKCKNNSNHSIEDIYNFLALENENKTFINFYSKDSLLYFIACVKGGINYDN